MKSTFIFDTNFQRRTHAAHNNRQAVVERIGLEACLQYLSERIGFNGAALLNLGGTDIFLMTLIQGVNCGGSSPARSLGHRARRHMAKGEANGKKDTARTKSTAGCQPMICKLYASPSLQICITHRSCFSASQLSPCRNIDCAWC